MSTSKPSRRRWSTRMGVCLLSGPETFGWGASMMTRMSVSRLLLRPKAEDEQGPDDCSMVLEPRPVAAQHVCGRPPVENTEISQRGAGDNLLCVGIDVVA